MGTEFTGVLKRLSNRLGQNDLDGAAAAGAELRGLLGEFFDADATRLLRELDARLRRRDEKG